MKYVYTRHLQDEELRPHLVRGDTIFLTEAVKEWQETERQVERLGFGDLYVVSQVGRPGPAGQATHTRVSPLRLQNQT